MWEFIYSKAGVLLITHIHSELHQCLCNRDSKDDAQKSQAEKDLEEIKKIVEESGGKLSNRRLQCEVGVQHQRTWTMCYCTAFTFEIIHWACQITVGERSLFLWAAGVWEKDVWWLNHSGNPEPRWPERWRFVIMSVKENKQMLDVCTKRVSYASMPDPGYCPVKLGMMGGRLQSGINTLQGFKEDKRNMIAPGIIHSLFTLSLTWISLCISLKRSVKTSTTLICFPGKMTWWIKCLN